MKRCIYCNYELNDNEFVCRYCGRPQQQEYNPYNNMGNNNQSINDNNINEKKDKNKKNLIIIVIVIILLLSILGFFLLNKKTDKKNNTEEEIVLKTFEGNGFTLEYDDNWTETNLGNNRKALVYKENNLTVLPVATDKLEESEIKSISTDEGRKAYYNSWYRAYNKVSEQVHGGSTILEKINDDVYYGYFNIGESAFEYNAQQFHIISIMNGIRIVIQASSENNYTKYNNKVIELIKTIKIQENNGSNNPINNNGDGKYIGTSEYGFVKVPNEWVRFLDTDGNNSYQYSDSTGTYIISLNAIQTTDGNAYDYINSIYKKLVDQGNIEEIIASETYASIYKAYEISGYYPLLKKYILIWTFEDGLGKTHYISLEGDSNIKNYISIIDSFTLNN